MLQPARVHLSAREYEEILGEGFGQFEWLYPDLTESLIELEAAATDASTSEWRTNTLRGLLAVRFDLLDYYTTLEDLDDTGVGWARALRHQLADILSDLNTLFRTISHPSDQWENADLAALALGVCDRIRAETDHRTAGQVLE